MNIDVFATSSKAARNLMSLGLIGLEISEKAGNQNLEDALRNIQGINVKCSAGENGFECHIADIDSLDVLKQEATIEIKCGSEGLTKLSVSASDGKSIEEVLEKAMSALDVHSENLNKPNKPEPKS
jgi:hypothetical protein